MKLLFITRKYPPMVGGMEKVSYNLAQELNKKTDLTLLNWGKSQKYLPFVIPYFLLKSIIIILKNKPNHIHLGDALLSPIGLILKNTFNIKTTVTVHGLDITYNSSLYQFIIPRCLKKLDTIICISRATKNECIKRGISEDACTVIPWGIKNIPIDSTRSDLEKIMNKKLNSRKVLVTVGRLVKRKGVYWFLDNVFSNLPTNYDYLIVGGGEEYDRIDNIIKRKNLTKRVYLLGKITNEQLSCIYNTADLFIMPNIRVENDIEGFGMVLLEASSQGLGSVASNIDGIPDALIDKKTGILSESENSKSFLMNIQKYNLKREKVKLFTLKNYSWEKVSTNYLRVFN